jgi:hypothetical protein
MKQTLLHEKYPVFVAEIGKEETAFSTVEEVAEYLKARIADNEKVKFIGVFNHLAHTRAIGGEIHPDIQGALDVIFCFGFALPNPQVLAVRPRTIGVADMGDKFVVSFLEAPMPPANAAMEAWVKGLRNKA